jgi:hypothetical protein
MMTRGQSRRALMIGRPNNLITCVVNKINQEKLLFIKKFFIKEKLDRHKLGW